ncbi:MAG: hypothetical protein HAW62_03870 [Endozoicomonadaceae bacterium]|nr:hypothetical protein [Endozoicomonadaceae bacterium]
MTGKNHQGVIVNLVDRRSKYVVLQKVESRKENEVKDSIIKYLTKISCQYRQTITFDHSTALS